MQKWTPLGLHRYKHQGNILWFESHGEFTLSDAKTYFELFRSLIAAQPAVGILADVRGGIEVPHEVRKYGAAVLRQINYPAPVAIAGASLPVRAILTLFTNAQRLIAKNTAPIVFVATQEQALEWLELRVAELWRKSSGPSSKPPFGTP